MNKDRLRGTKIGPEEVEYAIPQGWGDYMVNKQRKLQQQYVQECVPNQYKSVAILLCFLFIFSHISVPDKYFLVVSFMSMVTLIRRQLESKNWWWCVAAKRFFFKN